MEKKQRDILIAVVTGACVLVICVIVGRILLIGGIIGSTQETKITELNQPYEHNGLKITATTIRTIKDPSRGKVVVAVRLVFENLSQKSHHLSSTNATAYIDNVLADTAYGYFDSESDLYGDLLPGKSASNYFCVESHTGAKQIELNYNDSFFSKANVTFVLDIPPA